MAVDAMHKKTSELTHIWVDITSKCNNRCGYCYDAGNCNSDVTIEQLNKIFDLIQGLSVPNVILIGGEPTLHSRFLEILEVAKKVSSPTIITNGTMFADYSFCEKVAKIGVSGIMFSLTSPFEKEHDEITRRPGSFKELITGIKNISQFIPPQNIRTSTTITKSNYTDLKDVIDLDQSLGIYRSVFNVCVPSIRDITGSSCLEFDVLAKTIEELYFYSKTKDQSIKIATNLPFCIFSPSVRDELRSKHIIFTEPCQLFRGSGYEFLSDGSIIPCTHLHDCILDNPIEKGLSPSQFMDLINSEPFVKFRRSIWKYPSEKCKSCSEWEHCVGGCPLLWNAFSPDDYLCPIH